MKGGAIGVFDSGLGGLTAMKELESLLPDEDIIYFGDSGRMPYGSRERNEICSMAEEIARFLDSRGVQAMLIACGTITTNASDYLRARFSQPFFGVVDAACRAAMAATKTGHIGVIATEASIRSGAYEAGLHSLGDAEVIARACPSFAPAVEQGHFLPGDAIAEAAVRRELAPFSGSGIDTLLLGCTHYPLLADVISAYLGDDVALVSAGAEAAKELAAYLRDNGRLGSGSGRREYFTSGELSVFERSAALFLGHSIAAKRHIL